MAYLNANIPPIYCKVKTEYLYDMDLSKRGEEDCVVFGVTSISGRALLFHILLPNGAVYFRLPIALLVTAFAGPIPAPPAFSCPSLPKL